MITLIKKNILLFTVCILMFSCNENKSSTKKSKIVFTTNNIKKLRLNNKILNKVEKTLLSSSDSTLIPVSSKLFVTDNEYIVFSNRTSQIFRYDNKGGFINFIGKKGQGPREFTEIRDLIVNNNNNQIEILDNQTIVKYNFKGEFVKKNKHSLPAFSFGLYDNHYWFYLGNNVSKNKLVKTDFEFVKKEEFLPVTNHKMLPFMEDNFNKGQCLTFRESLSSDLYKINNNKLIHSYSIDFGSYQLSEEVLLIETPMELFKKLKSTVYAGVRLYLENKRYLFLVVFKHIPNSTPEVYYWILDKNSKRQNVIQIQDISEQSYLLNPQFLSKNNEIYFLGYHVSNKDEEIDLNSNPSVIKLKIDKLFNL